jgi:hypothetical protein
MKSLQLVAASALIAFSATALSAEPVIMEKVKTGLLSATETYSIYAVSCSNEAQTAVAALDRGTRWCVSDGARLNCFKNRDNAAIKACSATLLAAND